MRAAGPHPRRVRPAPRPAWEGPRSCPVPSRPQPKIVWMKNKVDVQGNPKYRALSDHGVCTLEIRKPGPFDSGVYTCKAVNVLGEASVDCRLEVKGEGQSAGHRGDTGVRPSDVPRAARR